MFQCPLHNWKSDTQVCPACYTTGSGITNSTPLPTGSIEDRAEAWAEGEMVQYLAANPFPKHYPIDSAENLMDIFKKQCIKNFIAGASSVGSQEWVSVDAELQRAEKKHPNYPTGLFEQLAIMQEEAGEVTKAVLHYVYEKGSKDEIRNELIQTAAMCMRMLKSLPLTN